MSCPEREGSGINWRWQVRYLINELWPGNPAREGSVDGSYHCMISFAFALLLRIPRGNDFEAWK